jgi:hypothetical protein
MIDCVKDYVCCLCRCSVLVVGELEEKHAETEFTEEDKKLKLFSEMKRQKGDITVIYKEIKEIVKELQTLH